jgi:hypothetical protein
LQKRSRSILDELGSLTAGRDRASVLESRADHVMQSAINLLSYINETYDAATAVDLERRLLNGIRNRDTYKFARAVRKINHEDK